MQDMQAELEKTEMAGAAGGGMVTVLLGGKGELRKVSIDKELPVGAPCALPNDQARPKPYTFQGEFAYGSEGWHQRLRPDWPQRFARRARQPRDRLRRRQRT